MTRLNEQRETLDRPVYMDMLEPLGVERPAGPWDGEPDAVTWTDSDSGYACLMTRNLQGHWCGYVAVPEGHPLYGMDYFDFQVDLDVHGGVNYANLAKNLETDEDVWLIGFHCGQWLDDSPVQSALLARARAEHGSFYSEVFEGRGEMFKPTYRTLEYVQAEVDRLAEQLSSIA